VEVLFKRSLDFRREIDLDRRTVRLDVRNRHPDSFFGCN
jgi:hypothetical protein